MLIADGLCGYQAKNQQLVANAGGRTMCGLLGSEPSVLSARILGSLDAAKSQFVQLSLVLEQLLSTAVMQRRYIINASCPKIIAVKSSCSVSRHHISVI